MPRRCLLLMGARTESERFWTGRDQLRPQALRTIHKPPQNLPRDPEALANYDPSAVEAALSTTLWSRMVRQNVPSNAMSSKVASPFALASQGT